jgi:hypothetical protein
MPSAWWSRDVDDERIKALTAEVMEVLHPSAGTSHSSPDTMNLEDRVTALEKAVQASVPRTVGIVSLSVHPSQSLLGPSAPPGGRCVMEPDKPCVQSGMCRTFGH